MKKTLPLIVIYAMALTACQVQEVADFVERRDIFTATSDVFESASKTAMNQDSRIVWSSEDRLAIFQGSSLADEFVLDEASAGQLVGTFCIVKDNSPVNGDFTSGSELPCNVAFYPYSESLALGGSAFEDETSYTVENVNLPEVQCYAKGSFANGAFPMVAVTDAMEDHDLKFKNVMGAVKLQFRGSQMVKSIRFEGKNGEKLSGAATVQVYSDNQSPVIKMAEQALTDVTLDCGDGVQLADDHAEEFIIALPPIIFEKGFAVSVMDSENFLYRIETSVSNTVMRSSLLVMDPITLEGGVLVDDGERIDYIDEYGVNHGKGTKVNGLIWAPVNCGYHAENHKWGKVYQWGRKYGQGYSGSSYDMDGVVPDNVLPDLTEGGISLEEGQSEANKNVYFYSLADAHFNWLETPDGTLWNSRSDLYPLKTEYDPCPEGWRVPSYTEMKDLCINRSSWTTNDAGQPGYWFSGLTTYSEEAARIFLPAAGIRDNYMGYVYRRGIKGVYWSSRSLYDEYADCLEFTSSSRGMTINQCADANSIRCVQITPDDDSLTEEDWIVPVTGVNLNFSEFNLYEGFHVQLTAKVLPLDATRKVVTWTSEDTSVATVDENGFVTAVSPGVVNICAQAEDVVSKCSITVSYLDPDVTYYVDEYGANNGPGVEIDGVVWAPVNCGYHITDYKWGKLYQWGRKYGQGYCGTLSDMQGETLGETSDKYTHKTMAGPVSLETGISQENANIFYTGKEKTGDWIKPQNDYLWNSGTAEDPQKTDYDPCPDGWRVPTYDEMNDLIQNRSSVATNDMNQPGYWFSGSLSYSQDVAQIFLTASGFINYYSGGSFSRGYCGVYWTSKVDEDGCKLSFGHSHMYINNSPRSYGYSVRCVLE